MGTEVRQCAGLWSQIAGKLLEEEAFGPLAQTGRSRAFEQIAFAVEQILHIEPIDCSAQRIIWTLRDQFVEEELELLLLSCGEGRKSALRAR